MFQVICGRDRLEWAGESEDDPNWQDDLDEHLISGLSAHDAQAFLAKCGIGSPADQSPTALQSAILARCGEDPQPETVRCHPLYLALCAEIVLSHRRAHAGEDPPVATFSGVPNDNVANELALRFLKSLTVRPAVRARPLPRSLQFSPPLGKRCEHLPASTVLIDAGADTAN